MRLIFVTQQVDPENPVLGATVAKLRALAARVEEVVVLADGAAPDALPSNCRVRLFRSGTKAGRGARFAAALLDELRRRPRPAAVVAHMCPIYAVLAAPLARPAGTRVILWFAHWKRTRTLDLAVHLSNTVASVDVRAVPIEARKVVGIGHGIDTTAFSCREAPAGTAPLEALALGRYSSAKGLTTMVEAVGLARASGLDVRLRCHGTAGNAQERDDRAALGRLVGSLGLDDFVVLGGPVPRSGIPELLASADVLVNNMRPGAPDKAVFEACACCVPVLVSNPLFDTLVDDLVPQLRFDRDDAGQLAERLAGFAALAPGVRHELGRTLRSRVAESHSVDSWADRIVALAEAR